MKEILVLILLYSVSSAGCGASKGGQYNPFMEEPLKNILTIQKKDGVFIGALGIKLGASVHELFRKYPNLINVNSDIEKACGYFNPRIKTEKGRLTFILYDNKVTAIYFESKIKKGTDINKYLREFVSILGKPDEYYLLSDSKNISIHYGRKSKRTHLNVEIMSDPIDIVKSAHWTYGIEIAYDSQIIKKMSDISDRCERKATWPFVGDCVKFRNIGPGLLNKGKNITTTGRVTMKSDDITYVYISHIDGASRLVVNGEIYYEKDEIPVPNDEIQSCD